MNWPALKTQVFWRDAFERIRNSFIGGAGASAALAWGASGLDLSQPIGNWSGWQKFGYALAVGGGTAAWTQIKVIYAGLKTGTASTSPKVAATAVEQPGMPTIIVASTPEVPA